MEQVEKAILKAKVLTSGSSICGGGDLVVSFVNMKNRHWLAWHLCKDVFPSENKFRFEEEYILLSVVKNPS